MSGLVKVWFENYQESVDSEADDYDADISEFLSSNGITEYATALMIPDGDRDGHTMVAELEIPQHLVKDLNQACVTTECPCDPEEANYI